MLSTKQSSIESKGVFKLWELAAWYIINTVALSKGREDVSQQGQVRSKGLATAPDIPKSADPPYKATRRAECSQGVLERASHWFAAGEDGMSL